MIILFYWFIVIAGIYAGPLPHNTVSSSSTTVKLHPIEQQQSTTDSSAIATLIEHQVEQAVEAEEIQQFDQNNRIDKKQENVDDESIGTEPNAAKNLIVNSPPSIATIAIDEDNKQSSTTITPMSTTIAEIDVNSSSITTTTDGGNQFDQLLRSFKCALSLITRECPDVVKEKVRRPPLTSPPTIIRMV